MDDLISNIQQSFNTGTNNNDTNNTKKLLIQQQTSQQNINDLLEQSAQSIMCGPSCQKSKVRKELKQKYLDAETNVLTAPSKLEQSKKNYYTYTKGETYYENMQEEELNAKAIKMAELISENFNNEIKDATTMNVYLNTALINSTYTEDLLEEYLKKNSFLKLKLKESRGDIITNDRKTFYETAELDKLLLWHRFFWYVYYILCVMLVLALILSPSDLSIAKKIVIAILVIAYPYYIDYVFRWFYGIWKNIESNLPKNVYNDL